MGKKTKATLFTMIVSIVNSIAIILFNLVYNNLVIRTYGSQSNGLISTLAQFVSLFSIIEGGFTTAAIVATYEPIVNKDYEKLNSVLCTTKRVYLRIGTIITFFVLVLGAIYIKIIDSPYSYARTFAFLIVTVLNTSLSLSFLSKYSVLLQGSNKEYLQVLFNLITKTVTWGISMILIIRGFDLIIVYSINILYVLTNILLCRVYEKRFFPQVTYKGTYDKSLISGTQDVLFQKIANTIFTSTDLILISVFINLASASVYNLYFQIFKSIFTLLASIIQAPFNSFGQMAQDKDKTRFEEMFNIYQHVVMIFSSILIALTGMLIISFVKVYTRNITDFEYVYPSLAVLFYMQIYAQIINRPFGTILNATGNFKMQNVQCAWAAVINVVVSLMFIKPWGINSIIFGSFCGTMTIVVANIVQVYKNVIASGAGATVKNITINFLIGTILIFICNLYLPGVQNYGAWVVEAILVSIAAGLLFIIVNLIIAKERTIGAIYFMKSIIDRKTKK